MEYEFIEMTGSNPADSEFPKVVWDEEDNEFYTAYFENGCWKSNDTQDGWFNRPLKNVTRWFEIRRTSRGNTQLTQTDERNSKNSEFKN